MNLTKELLTFPGNGVHTVSTGDGKKKALSQTYYQTDDFSQAQKKWEASLQQIDKEVVILGAPSDCGAGITRGSNWGPLFIREFLLKKRNPDFFDLGDIRVIPHLLYDEMLSPQLKKQCNEALYGKDHQWPVAPLSILEKISDEFFKNYPSKKLLTFGGDHSISLPLTKSWLKNQSGNVGILHFDAHTDLMPQRLGVDYCFGTWAFHALKNLSSPQHLVQVGLRSQTYTKEFWEQKTGVKQYWANEINDQSPDFIAEQIIAHFKKLKVDKLYLSFDIDVFDQTYVSATGTPESNGIEPYQAIVMLEKIGKEIPILAADLVEVAPYISYPSDQIKQEPYSTLDCACSVVETLLNYWK